MSASAKAAKTTKEILDAEIAVHQKLRIWQNCSRNWRVWRNTWVWLAIDIWV